MNKRTVITLIGAAFGLIAVSQPARADMIARYECSTAGFYSQEPIGDRPDHNLVTQDYVCVGVDGLLKGAVYSASNAVEWDGPKATIVFGGGVHRIPGGRLVTQLIEGSAQAVMKDGKPIGVESSGKGIVKFGSGPFAGLSGKSVKFVTTPVNPIRFNLEFTAD
ncbi:hypothetical protein ACVIWV_000268 [Bradyrhizobium diazoefficiens]|jgi:hypothetical protein|uniref:Uncharacterized protein n=1 Tax=Bradyrhizobium diazoefficiens TaxID=1355477 RepID=A0A0E4FTK7_9BRAD|nr:MULTISPECIES: hypothetical protein [Bradyrhizobium]MBR0867920.1 hypothetical protein [Bradyrhizobium diazoefficiens]MBR0892412.1 hypothetical protein [Bradyrhizobium diazoefficiens]MBR0924127.1 hypothetical protein [Bradyrhizobium diazoefficiens]QHP73907.1 hypothetical protein EI171_45695 [Bradyrhizobium sp. LCT2]WLA67004.1 hypothetical protein QNN01_10060 [Bradyrhizobium diazoefficiens]